MNTITKERAQQIFLGNGPEPTASEERELARIALASLEAEDKLSNFVSSQVSLGGEFEKVLAENLYELYVGCETAPPAPVSVPEPIKRNDADGWWMYKGRRVGGGCAEWYNLALDDCRAAMLQGADTELQRKAAVHDALCEKYNVESLEEFVDWQRNHIAELEAAPPAPVGEGETAVMPDYPGYTMTQRECFQAGKEAGLAEAGRSPVIPDGWVACSERMPDIGTEIFYFCQDDGLRDCGIVSSSNFSDKGDAQLYVHAEGYDLRFGVDITHWMPLPAAPQQDV
ncbi:TPA: DUF551 domain-containing protein [Escherichia coli]|uniref:DUF551 domain-containing protein n=1 Tax=Escherichia coli TaxID=562 RepID=UPI001559FC95|nr:DUF551 domain-containing protein [Escherichia coli]HBE6752514.1 DUF551 domain-containing protein [Escherichia coli]HBE6852901.1 DUF551 domain-containing protein [Escherichia coli]